ncbi:MAG: hypothetical protein NTU95_01095 [Methanothrix sp.]|nr:hypothetical protein [Methanothrix sp.]
MFAKTILVLLAAALLLPMLPLGGAQVENRSVETVAENLFNKGIGNAWVGGDPFASSTGMGYNKMHSATSLDSNYRIIGYLNVTTGLIVASDSGNGLHFTPGPGSYPVYGYFKANKMIGIFIDFNLL